MTTYKVQFAHSAAKEFRSLPTELKRRVGAAVDGLRQSPRHRVFANLWDTSACIGYGLAGIASYTRLTTRLNRFASREFDIGEKCTDSP